MVEQDMEVHQRKKYPKWAEEQRKKAAELARVRAIREKKMDRNKKEVGNRALSRIRLSHSCCTSCRTGSYHLCRVCKERVGVNGRRLIRYGCCTYPYIYTCLLYTSPSPRDATLSRMPSSA